MAIIRRGLQIVGIVATLAGAAGAGEAQAKTPAEIFVALAPSVWMVKATHADTGAVALGSAVVIGPRRLVTACHVVNGAVSVMVTHSKDLQQVAVARTASDPDPQKDLCVLTTTEDLGVAAVVIAPISSVKVGDPVFAIGSPLGLELTLTSGLVSSLRTNSQGVVFSIQASAPVNHGSSGGGLFDAQGRMIGVTVAAASETSEALNFALPAQILLDLPERREVALDAWHDLLVQNGVKLDAKGQPQPSGFAAIDNISSLPAIGSPEGMQTAYRQFLLKAHPRAFVVTSDGQWGAVISAQAMNDILQQCRQRGVHCAVYAVDDAVVWNGPKAAPNAAGVAP